MANSQCLQCASVPVETFYQHVHRAQGINHHWSKKPSQGATPTSAPYPDPCPTDPSFSSKPLYTVCGVCGHIQPWP